MSVTKLVNMTKAFRSYSESLALTETLPVMNKLVEGVLRSVEVRLETRF